MASRRDRLAVARMARNYPMPTEEVARRFPVGSRVRETRGNYGKPSPDTFVVVSHSRGGATLRSSKGTTHHVDGRHLRRA